MDVSVLSDDDLAALIRSLHEARFAEEPDDPIVWTSPFLIETHADALAEHQRRKPLSSDQAWLTWRGRQEHATVTRRIRADRALQKYIADNPHYIHELLKPFVVDSEIAQELVDLAHEGLASE